MLRKKWRRAILIMFRNQPILSYAEIDLPAWISWIHALGLQKEAQRSMIVLVFL